MARILVLDNDVALVVQTLIKAGHEVSCTRDRDAAARLAAETQPHIILAELTLGGLELCTALRRARNEAYFMLVSGRIMSERAADASVAGVEEYLLKPIRPRVLLKRIDEALEVVARRVKEDQPSRSRTTESQSGS